MNLHPVHVSLVNVEMSKNKHSFEITAKFFKDDFQTIILHKTGFSIDIHSAILVDAEKKAVCDYMNEHLKFNWQAAEYSFISCTKKQIDELSVWYFIKIPIKQSKGSLEIRNSLLLDLYNDQSNLFIFSYPENEISHIFNNKKRQTVFEIP